MSPPYTNLFEFKLSIKHNAKTWVTILRPKNWFKTGFAISFLFFRPSIFYKVREKGNE